MSNMFRTGLILITLGIPFFILGFVGIIFGMFLAFSPFEFNEELPLSDVNSILVNEKGEIFVHLAFYSKIQVYNNEGEFIRNWSTNTKGGSCELDVDTQGILLRSAKTKESFLYNEFGELIEKKTNVELKGNNSIEWQTTSGEKYQVEGLFFTSIAQTSPTKRTVISQNFMLHLLKGPFPAWFFSGILIGLGILALKIESRKKLIT